MFIQILKFCPKTFFPHFTFESLNWDKHDDKLHHITLLIVILYGIPHVSETFHRSSWIWVIPNVSKARWVFFFSKISYHDNSNKSCFYKQIHFKMALWHFLLGQLIAVLLIARLYDCFIRPRIDEAIKFGYEQGLALNSAGIKCRAWTVRVPYKNK